MNRNTTIVSQSLLMLAILFWMSPFLFLVLQFSLCGTIRGDHSYNCMLENLYWLSRLEFLLAIKNSIATAVLSVLITLLAVIGLTLPELAHSNGWFRILAPAIAIRCIPPIAFLIPYFVLVGCAQQYAPSIWGHTALIAAFHSIASLPLALLIVIPRVEILHKGPLADGGLYDLSRLDGVRKDEYFFKILLPNLWSEFCLAGLIGFSISWGESLFSGAFQNGRHSWTMPVFISSFETSYEIAWKPLFSTMLVSISVLAALAVVSMKVLNRKVHADE